MHQGDKCVAVKRSEKTINTQVLLVLMNERGKR